MLNFLKILPPEKALKLLFPNGRMPRGVESSIYAAATRKRMRVRVYVRDPAVYICDNSDPERRWNLVSFKARCQVCKAAIEHKPGAGKQYVCAGTKKKKSECQKIWRYSREHGIPVEQAIRRRNAQAPPRYKDLR